MCTYQIISIPNFGAPFYHIVDRRNGKVMGFANTHSSATEKTKKLELHERIALEYAIEQQMRPTKEAA